MKDRQECEGVENKSKCTSPLFLAASAFSQFVAMCYQRYQHKLHNGMCYRRTHDECQRIGAALWKLWNLRICCRGLAPRPCSGNQEPQTPLAPCPCAWALPPSTSEPVPVPGLFGQSHMEPLDRSHPRGSHGIRSSDPTGSNFMRVLGEFAYPECFLTHANHWGRCDL